MDALQHVHINTEMIVYGDSKQLFSLRYLVIHNIQDHLDNHQDDIFIWEIKNSKDIPTKWLDSIPYSDSDSDKTVGQIWQETDWAEKERKLKEELDRRQLKFTFYENSELQTKK